MLFVGCVTVCASVCVCVHTHIVGGWVGMHMCAHMYVGVCDVCRDVYTCSIYVVPCTLSHCVYKLSVFLLLLIKILLKIQTVHFHLFQVYPVSSITEKG